MFCGGDYDSGGCRFVFKSYFLFRFLGAMEGGKRSVLASFLYEELPNRMYQLCGFTVVLVKDELQAGGFQGEVARGLSAASGSGEGRSGGGRLDLLVGAECSLQGRGSDVHLRVEGRGLCLRPLLAEDVVIDDEREQRLEPGAELVTVTELLALSNSPQVGGPENWRDCKLVDEVVAECAQSAAAGAASGAKRKRGGVGSVNRNGEGLLHQLQWLCTKNNARVQGRVLTLSRKGDETRVVVMLNLYLPPSAWMGSSFWKSGATAAAALSHMRSVNAGSNNECNTELLSFMNFYNFCLPRVLL